VRRIPAPPAITAPTPVPPPAALPPADTDTATTTTRTGTTPATTRTTPAKTTTTTAPPSKTPGLQEVSLGPDAASVYDPYHSASDQTDPADAYDDKADTVFTLTALLGGGQAATGQQTTTAPADTTSTATTVATTPAATVTTGTVVPTTTTPTTTTTTTATGDEQMGVGLDFSFDKPTEVSALRVQTTTPGFTIEVYGTDQGLPSDLLDTAWRHLATAKRLGALAGEDGVRVVTIPRARYRHVLLWFTTPPTPAADATGSEPGAPPTVGISDVKVLD
ncbi:MAG TPA: hypothetical protein VHB30_03060, partial [Solirubrobacteraceae bacterium]|nr:hypothetical protein [Solirubrobacteraceae bacterium]